MDGFLKSMKKQEMMYCIQAFECYSDGIIGQRHFHRSLFNSFGDDSTTFSFNVQTFSHNLRKFFEKPLSHDDHLSNNHVSESHHTPLHNEDIGGLSMSDVMTFQRHEFFETKLRNYVENGFEKIKTQPLGASKADAFAFFINGGKGVGKTRTTIETVERFTLEYKDRLSKVLYLYLPFSEMCPIREEIEMFGLNELLNYQRSKKLITARMLYSYFTQTVENDEVLPYRDFLDQCYHFIPDDVEHATDIIRHDCKLRAEEELCMFIVVDDCDELLKIKFEHNLLSTPYSVLLRLFKDFPGIFKDKTNSIYVPLIVGVDVVGMVNDWVHKLGPTRPTYSGSSYQKHETFTITQLPLLNHEQVEKIVDNMFEKKGQIPIENEYGIDSYIDKDNWRDSKSFSTALAMMGGHPLALEYFLMFIASVKYLHEDFYNFQYALEKTKYELKKLYDFESLGKCCKDNQIEKIIVSLLSHKQLLEVVGYKNYEFHNFYTYMNSGIVFPVIKPEEDEVIEFNNYNNLERVVNVPFIFLDELIAQIPEDSKSKQVFSNLCTSLKNLLDLQLLEEPIPRKQIKIINTKYYEAMKEVKEMIKKPPAKLPFMSKADAITPEFYSPYVRDLLACYFNNWKDVLKN